MSLYSRLIICLSFIHHCKSVEVTSTSGAAGKCRLVPAEEAEIFKTIAREAHSAPVAVVQIELEYGEEISYTDHRDKDAPRTDPETHAVTFTCRNNARDPWTVKFGDAESFHTTDARVAGWLNAKLTTIRNWHTYREKPDGSLKPLRVEYEWPTIRRSESQAYLTRTMQLAGGAVIPIPMDSAATGRVVSPGIAGSTSTGRQPDEAAPLSLGEGSSTSSKHSASTGSSGSTGSFDAIYGPGPGKSAHENYYDLMDDYYYDLEVEEARQKRAMSRLQRQKRAISRLQRQRKHARAHKIAAKSRRFRYKSYN